MQTQTIPLTDDLVSAMNNPQFNECYELTHDVELCKVLTCSDASAYDEYLLESLKYDV